MQLFIQKILFDIFKTFLWQLGLYFCLYWSRPLMDILLLFPLSIKNLLIKVFPRVRLFQCPLRSSDSRCELTTALSVCQERTVIWDGTWVARRCIILLSGSFQVILWWHFKQKTPFRRMEVGKVWGNKVKDRRGLLWYFRYCVNRCIVEHIPRHMDEPSSILGLEARNKLVR